MVLTLIRLKVTFPKCEQTFVKRVSLLWPAPAKRPKPVIGMIMRLFSIGAGGIVCVQYTIQ